MKKLLILVLALLASNAYALIPESHLSDPGSDGRNVKRVGRATYTITGYSSTKGSSTYESGVHNTGLTLPAKSVITDSYLYVNEALVGDSVGGSYPTIAFKCEDANNIFTAADIKDSTAGTVLSGTAYGADSSGAANMSHGIAADCRVKATVAVGSFDTGKVTVFVEYVVAGAD